MPAKKNPRGKTPKKLRRDRKREIESLRRRIRRACRRSPDFKDTVPVFGTGPVPCSLMVVGEAPGRVETREGRPFVGRAGKFFVSILEDVFGKKRDDIYITNVVKVWPTIKTKRLKTRTPTKKEEEFFRPFLTEEIRIVNPRVIVAVGKTAFSALVPGGEFRPGAWTEGPEGFSVMPVYHPAYLLRQQKKLKEHTDELKSALGKVRRRLSKKG